MAEGEQTRTTDPPIETDEPSTADTVPENMNLTTGANTKESLTRRLKERGGHRSTVTRSIGDMEYTAAMKNTNKLKRLKKTPSDKAA